MDIENSIEDRVNILKIECYITTNEETEFQKKYGL